MPNTENSNVIDDISVLEKLYGPPTGPSLLKEIDYIHSTYKKFIEASPFVVIASAGHSGLDASPRGDKPGFVYVEDEKTLLIPDRPGNNRFDSLRNILEDPHVALFFMVPGVGETMRVNGRASISIDPDLLGRFVVNQKPPRSVIVVHVDTIFLQCSKAIVRSDIWNPEKHLPRADLPSIGTILADVSKGKVDAKEFDDAVPERIKKTLY